MIAAQLQALVGDRLLFNEPLAKYTAVRLGGPADMLYVANQTPAELAAVVRVGWSADIPVRVIGGGANVLISDAGVPGLVVINRIKQITFNGHKIHASAGASLTTLANQCASHGVTGFEWAVSVPGTVGGAVVNNAGAHGGDMSDAVHAVQLLDATHTEPIWLSPADLAYDYRTSSLKQRANRQFLVLLAVLQLAPAAPDTIRERMTEFRAHRKRTQPPGASLGSIFKNPPDDYAGRLIEAAGLKGRAVGGAAVSDRHANFFINTGGATATDYAVLIQQVQAAVYHQFGISLEPEIEQVGEF